MRRPEAVRVMDEAQGIFITLQGFVYRGKGKTEPPCLAIWLKMKGDRRLRPLLCEDSPYYDEWRGVYVMRTLPGENRIFELLCSIGGDSERVSKWRGKTQCLFTIP